HEVSYNLITNNGRKRAGNRPSGLGWSGIGVYKVGGDMPGDTIRILQNTVTRNHLGFPGALPAGTYLTGAWAKALTNLLGRNNIVADNGDTNYEYYRRAAAVQVKLKNNLFARSGQGTWLRNVETVFSGSDFSAFVRAAGCSACLNGNPRFVSPGSGDLRLAQG